MANLKITELDALGTTPDDADIFPMVDDVAGSATTKKVTYANLIAGAGGGDMKIPFTYSLDTAAIDSGGGHLSSYSDAGSVAQVAGGISIQTSAASEKFSFIFSREANSSTAIFNGFDSDPEIFAALHLSATSGNFTCQFTYGCDILAFNASGSSTAKHFGFCFDSGTLYASNANGTTQTKTDISSGLTLTSPNLFKAVMDSGTNIKFYVNGSLKTTHTTNLPSGANATTKNVVLGIDNDTGDTTNHIVYTSNIGWMAAL